MSVNERNVTSSNNNISVVGDMNPLIKDLQNTKIPSLYLKVMEDLRLAMSKLSYVNQHRYGFPLLKKLYPFGFPKNPEQLVEEHKAEIQNVYQLAGETFDPDRRLRKSTRAMHKMINDIYWRAHVLRQENGFSPPLHSWVETFEGVGTQLFCPDTFLDSTTSKVALPKIFAFGGILAWIKIALEVSSLDISRNSEVIKELKSVLQKTLSDEEGCPSDLVEFWVCKTEAIVKDVLGILNLGSTGAMGLIGYLNWLNPDQEAISQKKDKNPYSSTSLRKFLAISIVKKLDIETSFQWGKIILNLIMKEFFPDGISVNDKYNFFESLISNPKIKTVRLVVDTICNAKLQTLNHRSLKEINSWDHRDEEHVRQNRILIQRSVKEGLEGSAKHIVVAAFMESLINRDKIPQIFRLMVAMLVNMRSLTATWHSVTS